jgi:hypothetical protein
METPPLNPGRKKIALFIWKLSEDLSFVNVRCPALPAPLTFKKSMIINFFKFTRKEEINHGNRALAVAGKFR